MIYSHLPVNHLSIRVRRRWLVVAMLFLGLFPLRAGEGSRLINFMHQKEEAYVGISSEPKCIPLQIGTASWYGVWHHGRPTASGERFDMLATTAAHPSLPLGTCVELHCPETGRWAWAEINDRGPYIPGRIIDLSWRLAHDLGIAHQGIAEIEIWKGAE